jgi:hypothetical protein
MRFQNVKPEELEGPIKLPGFQEWTGNLQHNPGITSVLLTSGPGLGKGSAIGSLAETLHYDVVRCRLSQLLEYPNPAAEFRVMLEGTKNLHRTVLWLDGVDRFLTHIPGGADEGQGVLQLWLETEKLPLERNEVIVVATAREASKVPHPLAEAFDQSFQA